MKMKTDNELRTVVTGNSDRLADDELDLVVWCLRLDLKGDMGLHSSAGAYEVSGNFKPIGKTRDSAGVVTSMYVKKPMGSAKKNEMGDRMLDAVALDRAARAMLADIGDHRETLWKVYVAKYPEGLRASLAAFADLAPLVPSTKAAGRWLRRARAAGGRVPDRFSFCQGLSARIIESQQEGVTIAPEDLIAMQEICDEAEPILKNACSAVKSALRRHRHKISSAKRLKASRKNEGT